MLTKCYLFKIGGVKVDLVIAKNLLRVIGDEELKALSMQVEEIKELSDEEEKSINITGNSKAVRKNNHETSADNLLRQSPTLLDFYMRPELTKMEQNRREL